MDFTAEHLAIEELLRDFGGSCKVSKPGNDSPVSTIGVVLSAQVDNAVPDSFISGTEKVVYLSGKIKSPPENGDRILLKNNLYIIKSLRAIAVGEGPKNVFAYRCVVSV